MAENPGLTAQMIAVERAAVNERGHIAALRPLVERNRRSRLELEIAEKFYTDLVAAAHTLRALNEQMNRETDKAIAAAMEGLNDRPRRDGGVRA